MTRKFVITSIFENQWKKIGLTDDDLRRLQLEILQNPEQGVIMQGTGGLRKIRFALENRGKSGSARVCYIDFLVYETIFLLTLYTKNEKDNLTQKEKNDFKVMIDSLEKELKMQAERSVYNELL